MARRRKPNRVRSKAGRILASAIPVDRGTPEVQFKRQAAVGIGGDPNLSGSMVGIYLARGRIEPEDYTAALVFRGLYTASFGPAWPSNNRIGVPASEAYLQRTRSRLERIARALGDGYRIVRDLAVYDTDASSSGSVRNQLNLLQKYA